MRKIIFGFSRPKKWKPFAELIQFVDQSNVSHGYTRFESDRWNASFVYQSSGHRTNFMGGTLFDLINVRVEEYCLEVPDEVEAKIGNLCVTREGKPYALKQVVGKGLVLLVAFMTMRQIKIKNPFPNGDKQTDCIEEQAAILSQGLGINTPLDMDSVTVKPFRDWLVTIPNIKKIGGEQ